MTSLRQMAIASRRFYTQGQYDGKFREYFYYVSHEGMLFLDDSRMKNFTAAYKDLDFLDFFFKRLRVNDTNRFSGEFPFVSYCGRERNYLKCDDRPIVYTQMNDERSLLRVGQSRIFQPFQPSGLFMKTSGRLYHPAPFADYALVRDKLADELHTRFDYDTDGFPTTFRSWDGDVVQLDAQRGR